MSNIVCLLGHFPWLQHVQDSTPTVVFEGVCQTLSICLVISLDSSMSKTVHLQQSLKVRVEHCPWSFPWLQHVQDSLPTVVFEGVSNNVPGHFLWLQYIQDSLWRCVSNSVLGCFPWLRHVQDSTRTLVFEGVCRTLSLVISLDSSISKTVFEGVSRTLSLVISLDSSVSKTEHPQ